MVEFQQGLLITAIGMGLVFAVIILLWGLMALMMRLTSREPQMDDKDAEDPLPEVPEFPVNQGVERKRRAAAAALAVRIALAGGEPKTTDGKLGEMKGALSPWQIVNRLRQLENRKR